jgi:hypothetical protein
METIWERMETDKVADKRERSWNRQELSNGNIQMEKVICG